jgi:hypothetical protein
VQKEELPKVVEYFVEEDNVMQLTDDETYENEVLKQMEELENQDLTAQQEEELIRQRRERLLKFQEPLRPNGELTRPAVDLLEEKKPLVDEEIPWVENSAANGTTEIQDDIFDGADVDDDLFSADVQPTAIIKQQDHMDEVDDAEGYYYFKLGDLLAGRYEVFANQGRGVFSTVLRVRDRLGGNKELVLKVIRRNDVMYKAGVSEIDFLHALAEQDPENKKHVVRLYAHFEHRNHLCLIFEPMHMNLRELLKKFGGEGVSIEGVQVFAKHLFIALRHLKRSGLVHADL